jgi:hypothetical protein
MDLPVLEHPTPQVCHGRQELEQVLRHWAEHGLRAEVDEVAASGELVMVGRADARDRRPPRVAWGRSCLQCVHGA